MATIKRDFPLSPTPAAKDSTGPKYQEFVPATDANAFTKARDNRKKQKDIEQKAISDIKKIKKY